MVAGCGSLNSFFLRRPRTALDRKSTRLNSSHGYISYAVFCLKKKKTLHYELFEPFDTTVEYLYSFSAHTTTYQDSLYLSHESAQPCHFSATSSPMRTNPLTI